MITDERLRDLISKFNRSLAYAHEDTEDVMSALSELLRLRKESIEIRGIDDGTEKCMECGCMVESVWHTSDDLWLKYSGFENLGGVLCMRCFDRKYEAAKQEERRDGKSHGILYWDAHEGEDFITYDHEKLKQESAEKDEQIREWWEDAERVAKYVKMIGLTHDIEKWECTKEAIINHSALLEKYNKQPR